MNNTPSRIESIDAIQGVVVHPPNLLSNMTISKAPNKRNQIHIHKQGKKTEGTAEGEYV